MYALLHPGRQLLSLQLAGQTIFTGLTPKWNSIGMSRMKARWSPTPYPNGITHALLMSRLLDTHKPLIGFEPWKNFALGRAPVWWRIALHKSNPSLSTKAFPRLPSITCSLWSMNRTILSHAALHCFRCLQDSCKIESTGRLGSSFLWWNICVAAGKMSPTLYSCSYKGCMPLWFVCYARLTHPRVSNSICPVPCCLVLPSLCSRCNPRSKLCLSHLLLPFLHVCFVYIMSRYSCAC